MQEIFTIPTVISIAGFVITIGTLIFKAGKDNEKLKNVNDKFEDYIKKNDDYLKLLNGRIDDMRRIEEVDGKVEDVKERFTKHEDNQNKRDIEMFQTLREISSAVGRLEGKNSNN